jgi:lipopolysaccharide export LptBFGC system permease protein LptF
MKISITRGLSELKVLKNRYEREIREAKLIGVSVANKMVSPYTSYKPSDFEAQAKSGFQSLVDLEKRIIEIKTKIDQSNFVTKVKVAGEEMTVLEAIEMKNLVDLKEQRLLLLKQQLKSARSSFEEAEKKNRERIEKNVADQTAAGTKDAELEAKVKASIESLYPIALIDPIKVEDEIKKEEKFLEDFKNEIDFVLSESNSLTYIEICD